MDLRPAGGVLPPVPGRPPARSLSRPTPTKSSAGSGARSSATWPRSWAILAGIVLVLAALLLWLGDLPRGAAAPGPALQHGDALLSHLPPAPGRGARPGSSGWPCGCGSGGGRQRKGTSPPRPRARQRPGQRSGCRWPRGCGSLILFALFPAGHPHGGRRRQRPGPLLVGSLVGLSHARKAGGKGRADRSEAFPFHRRHLRRHPGRRPGPSPPAAGHGHHPARLSPGCTGTFWPGADRLDQDFGDDFLRPTSLELEPVDEGSLGLRHQHWWEFRGEEQLAADCYTARWEWLSRLVLALKLASWSPGSGGRPRRLAPPGGPGGRRRGVPAPAERGAERAGDLRPGPPSGPRGHPPGPGADGRGGVSCGHPFFLSQLSGPRREGVWRRSSPAGRRRAGPCSG